MTLFHIVLYLICLLKLKVYNWLYTWYIPYFFGDEKKEVSGLVTYLFLPFEVMGPYICNVIHVCFWFWFPITTFPPIYHEYLIKPVCKYYTYNSIDKKCTGIQESSSEFHPRHLASLIWDNISLFVFSDFDTVIGLNCIDLMS